MVEHQQTTNRPELGVPFGSCTLYSSRTVPVSQKQYSEPKSARIHHQYKWWIDFNFIIWEINFIIWFDVINTRCYLKYALSEVVIGLYPSQQSKIVDEWILNYYFAVGYNLIPRNVSIVMSVNPPFCARSFVSKASTIQIHLYLCSWLWR